MRKINDEICNYNENIEYKILNTTSLATIERIIVANIIGKTLCFGDFARVLVSEKNHGSILDTFASKDDDYLQFNKLKKCDCIVSTHFKFLYNLFIQNKLYYLVPLINDKFVFLIPVCGKSNNIKVCWGEGFGKSEESNGSYLRWFISRISNSGSIYIVNNGGYTKNINIKFNLWSINPKATLRVMFNDFIEIFELNGEWVNIEINKEVSPGINSLDIEYDGNIVKQLNGDIRALKFVVSELNVIESEEGVHLAGKDIYENENKFWLYQYMLSDDYIRSILHTSGFFDVESYHGYSFDKYIYSRYLVSDQLYRVIKSSDNNVDGVRLYVAKRKGYYNER